MHCYNSMFFRKIIISILCGLLLVVSMPFTEILAEDNDNNTEFFSLYIFDDNKYSFSAGTCIDGASLGNFAVLGDYIEATENSIPSFYINSGNLIFQYKWDVEDIEVENEWYIGSESRKKVGIYDLEDKLGKGTIIIQSSKDRINWSTNEVIYNFVEDLSAQKEYEYETDEIQVNSGCYYRIIVAYKMERYTTKKILFLFNKKEYEYERFAEVYTFYAINSNSSINTSVSDTKYVLSSSSKYCRQFSGYADTTEINVNDIHYGWKLGDFLVSGHTDVVMDNENIPVVLKNVGDQTVLWFRLEQNINSLNGNEDIYISSDSSGKDQYFGTETQAFGRGVLFISKKDNQREQQEVEVYTNYLEADVVPGVDTMIALFEEGDYEVTLDYQVTKTTFKLFGKKIADKTRHYKIDFKFKVRNSNCMVYPLDVATGEKLINGSYTKDGFYLDLAKSKYLQISIKKSNLKDGSLELVEDVQFNQLAKDGDRFTEEGLYTITVTNRYTNISDEKRIYVGDNDILKAYAVTGKSISEIKKLIEGGAIINEDGTIGTSDFSDHVQLYAGLEDEDLLTYVEDSVYLNLISDLQGDGLFIEKVEAKYLSKDYIENLSYNSMKNIYFGYDAAELDAMLMGQKYVFTLGDNYQTIVIPLETIDDTVSEQVLKNVVVGSGVILICATVSIVAAPTAPALSVILAASATTGTSFALKTGAISGITAAIYRAYQTGDMEEALKSGVVASSEGFKWGAISGSLEGGASEAWGLYRATGNGLTMNQVATIQQESGYPLSIIKQFHTVEEYTVFKNAGLQAEMVGGKLALVRTDIDLYNVLDEYKRNNYTRMSQGLNPIDAFGREFQWHHIGQNNNATLALLTAEEHKNGALHGFKVVSEIDRKAFTIYKKEVLNKALLKYLLASAG